MSSGRKKTKNKKKTSNDTSKIAKIKMVVEDIRFIIPRNSFTDVKDTWLSG